MCPICLELPKPWFIQYYQCKNGHLVCTLCYRNLYLIGEDDDSKCPICRVSMKDPHRNRIAENHVKNMIVCCKENGCNEKMKYSELSKHLANECQHVLEKCHYCLLGCKWEGPRGLQKDHIHNNMTFDQILEKVEEIEDNNYELEEKLDIANWVVEESDLRLNACKSVCEELELKIHETNQMMKQTEDENICFRKYHKIISQSDVNAEFDLVHIWNDFRLKYNERNKNLDPHSLTHCIALRFTGNHNRSYKLTLWFRPYQQQLLHSGIGIECKVSVKCEAPCKNRHFQVLVLPSSYKTNRLVDGISIANHLDTFQIQRSSDIDTFNIYEGECVREWSSNWRQILNVNADSILQADEIMNKYGQGVIKVFAYSRNSV